MPGQKKALFCVVYQVGEDFFSPRSVNEVRGVKPDRVWCFGAATSPEDVEIRDATMAVCCAWNVPMGGVGLDENGRPVPFDRPA